MIEVRSATTQDCKDIFEWRNDVHTREMSHNTTAAVWEDHQVWFDQSLKNENRCLLICMDAAGNKVGVVRFDIDQDFATVSINLNPDARGKGLARPCLAQSIGFAKDAFPELRLLRAEVKSVNVASQKLFIGVGFELETEIHGVDHYKLTL